MDQAPHVQALDQVANHVAEADYLWALRPTPAGVNPNAPPPSLADAQLDGAWMQERRKDRPAIAVQAPFQVFAPATAGAVFGRQGSAQCVDFHLNLTRDFH